MEQLILPSSGSVYLDANAMIYSAEKIDPYYTLLQPLWQAVKQSHIAVVSSELLLLETLVKPIREENKVLENIFREIFTSSEDIQLIPISKEILEQAAYLRATVGLKPPDAIHAATGLFAHCSLFITNDAAFTRVKELPVALLKDFL